MRKIPIFPIIGLLKCQHHLTIRTGRMEELKTDVSYLTQILRGLNHVLYISGYKNP